MPWLRLAMPSNRGCVASARSQSICHVPFTPVEVGLLGRQGGGEVFPVVADTDDTRPRFRRVEPRTGFEKRRRRRQKIRT